MKEGKIFKVLDKFKGCYEKIGVDYDKMKLILKMKLIMDQRRSTTVVNNSNNGDKDKNYFKTALIMYSIMGAFIGVFNFLPFNAMYRYTIIISMFMFFVLTIFIADFSSVLLDLRDKNIIGITGVDSKTINAAKVTHMAYYIFLISLALQWLSIVGMFKDGIIIGLLFIIELVIIDLFMIVVTALLYLFILRFFNGEKVKDIINYIQIMLTIVMAIGYQLIARMFNFSKFTAIYQGNFKNVLVPPMWFASPLYIIKNNFADKILIVLTIMAIVVPIISMYAYIKNTDKFEDLLYKLNLSNLKEKKNKGLFYSLGKVLCGDKDEKIMYDFCSSLMRREREFKLRVYPNLGMTIIFPILMVVMFQNKFDLATLRNGSINYSLNIYWMMLMIPSTMIMIQFSKSYKGKWIFEASYLKDKSVLYKAAYKAILANMLAPIFIFESLIFLFIFGPRVIPNLIICFLHLSILIVFIHVINKFNYPFTEEFSATNQNQEQSIVSMLASLVIMAILALINVIVAKNIYTIIIYILLLSICNYFAWKKGIRVKIVGNN